MSIEITQEDIEASYRVLDREHAQDWELVASAFMDAEREGTSTDGAFGEELAEMRWQQALGYDYPVPKTGPTKLSSLRIVRDIMTIRELRDTADQRREAIAMQGADIMLAGAIGAEHMHRVWEKGILRIFDHRTRKTVWSVEFDQTVSRV